MIAVSALAVVRGSRDRTKPVAPPPAPIAERPWLTNQAAAQVITADGTLGPLFGTLTLGGLAPTPEERARVDAFAKANDVRIDLDTVDDELVAIRFAVTYGGCCGYEGAEVLALRAHRPTRGGGCMREPATWVSDWSIAHDDGTHLRASVDHNRVTFRWERTLTADEVLERADATIGTEAAKLSRTTGDHLRSLGAGGFLLEVPYDQGDWESASRSRLGMSLTAERGRVNEVSVIIRSSEERTVEEALRARWGRPAIRDTVWTWRKGDRVIEADVVERTSATVTLRRAV